jgi:hypothetical protein
LARPAGPHHVGQAEQLKAEDQGGERGHGDEWRRLAIVRQCRKSSLSFG